MSEQYFTRDPQSKSNPKTWTFELLGQTLTFTSDVGVFSKNRVDFGSITLIEAFQMPDGEGAIVDIGCGYGPIGLSIAKAYPDHEVIMGDVNHRAVELAKENIERNGIENATCYLSDRFESLPDKRFKVVVVNPPIRVGKKVVHQMFEDAYEHLNREGELWVVIQKKQGAPSAVKKIEALFKEVEIVTKNKGYYIIRAKKI